MQKSSRRDFIFTAAAASGAALAPGPANAAPQKSATWSAEADVVVLGSGAAGLSAAIAAQRAGASVIILEKGASVGGTTIKSEAAFWIPNNHLMRARGIADPREDCINFMARYAFPGLYRENQPMRGIGERAYSLIEAYYDQAASIIENLEQAGILKSIIYMLCSYHDHASQNRALRGRILGPRKDDGTPGGGPELIRQLQSWLVGQRIPILTRHAASSILRNSKGEVIGVTAETRNGIQTFRARKGVIFGTGGYTHNKEMLTTYQPGPIYGGCAVPTNQGDFIRLGTSVGAQLGNMVNAWRAQLVLEQALQTASVAREVWVPPGDSMILVNKYGRRVVNEKRSYNERTRVHFDWDANEAEFPNQFLFMVFDQRSLELYGGNFPLPNPGASASYIISANGPEELAKALQQRLDRFEPQIGDISLAPDFAATLKDQIAAFSKHAKNGVDPQFSRGKFLYDREWHTQMMSKPRKDTNWPLPAGENVTVYPFAKSGPLHAIILAAGNLDTNGGPMTNAKAQVLDAGQQPIPGLYGAGNCVASPAGQAYWDAGGTIGPAITFGAIAGRLAAAESVKEEG